MNRLRTAFLPLCTLALTLACGGDSSGPPAVDFVDITVPAGGVTVGQTTQLTAITKDKAGNALTNRVVTWSTLSSAVATVSSSGIVTGVSAGSVTITATSEGKNATVGLIVGPVPVASVTVTVGSNALQVNQTTQAAAVTRDAGNAVLTGRVVTWSTSNVGIATISASGLVTGLTAGTVTITGTSEGRTGSTDIVVTVGNPADAPQITAVTPAVLAEGQAATITGTKFGGTAAGNVVRIGGVAASVTSATTTSLEIIVPVQNCKPAQNLAVDVTVAGVTSAARSHAYAPPSRFAIALAQGKQQIVGNPAEFCLQFGATTGSERYLIGVQSTSESGASLTPVKFTAEAATGGASLQVVPQEFATPNLPAPLSPTLAPAFAEASSLRLTRHRAVESQILAQDAAVVWPHLAARVARVRRSNATATVANAPTVPASAKVGDVLNIRVPDRTRNTCLNFLPITVTVKAVGTHAIFLEDNANPTGGFSSTDYQTLSTEFDTRIYPTDVGYFGAPTDFDGNARTAIVVTREVNKIDNLLGVVYSANFATQGECAASNEGEFFYGRAPDPSGAAGQAYAVADALEDAPIIIAHEFTHVIQLGRRYNFEPATSFPTVWEAEGQATLSEEINGYAATGLAPGQNLGPAVLFNQPALAPVNWFIAAFSGLVNFYGFGGQTTKVPNAPEQCSWLSLKSQGNTGPCLGDGAVYGASWSFLRWISDQYGPAFPGGEQGLHKRLIDNAFAGFATISDVTGVSIDVLLARWAAALYVDDRVSGLDPTLRFTSWNLKAIEDGITATARLTPYERQFGAFTDDVAVRGGSTAYFLVSGNGRSATGIRARDASDGTLPAVMRMWVVRLQ